MKEIDDFFDTKLPNRQMHDQGRHPERSGSADVGIGENCARGTLGSDERRSAMEDIKTKIQMSLVFRNHVGRSPRMHMTNLSLSSFRCPVQSS